MAYTVESFKSKNDNLFSFQSGSFLCNTLHIKMTEKKKKKTNCGWEHSEHCQWPHSSYLKKIEKTVQCLAKFPFSFILCQNYLSSLANV